VTPASSEAMLGREELPQCSLTTVEQELRLVL
jgi:hypothetical protein